MSDERRTQTAGIDAAIKAHFDKEPLWKVLRAFLSGFPERATQRRMMTALMKALKV